ncbi:hypothetical protein ACFLZI_01205 [Nitrospirota bacterium]
MKKIILLLVMLSFLAPGAVFAETDWTGNINFFLGTKSLKRADWDPVEEQVEAGIEIAFGKRTWPVMVAFDFMSSSRSEGIFGLGKEGETSEMNIGIRKSFNVDNMHPFVGAGLSNMHGEFISPGEPACTGNGTGTWLAGGIYWTLGSHFNLGFEAKSTSANATFSCPGGNVDADIGGGHFGLLLGYHF